MLAETVDAVIGIDTHRDSHEVEIADAAGRPITTMRIGDDSAGFRQVLAAIAEDPSKQTPPKPGHITLAPGRVRGYGTPEEVLR